MRRPTIIAASVLLLVLAAVAGWYYLSPGWTLRSMVEAAKANDEERFSSYVDYPALREDLSTEMGQRLKAAADRDGNPAAQLGAAMGMALMKPLVDAMVSPQGMKIAFSKLAKEEQEASQQAPATGGGGRKARPMPKIERIGFNRFRVSGQETPGQGFVFERRGLGWKLVGVDLAPEAETQP
jgi:hypothetical protein